MSRECTVYKVLRTWSTDLEPGTWYELAKNDGRDIGAGFVFLPHRDSREHDIVPKGWWDYRDVDGRPIMRRGNLKGAEQAALDDKIRGFDNAILTHRHGACWCETPLYPARGCCPRCVASRTEVPVL